MEVRGFNEIDEAAEALMSMLRDRLQVNCRLFAATPEREPSAETEWAIDLVDSGGNTHAILTVSQGMNRLTAADRALVELAARLLTTLVNARRELATAWAEAETDPLTGLANRRGWDRRMESFDHRRLLEKSSMEDHAVVTVVDLEGLKDLNDLRGHAAGDDLLKRAATALETACRPGRAARIGGDEFAVWSMVEAGQAAAATTEKLRTALAAAGVPAAIGSARYDGTRSTSETFAEADRRMVAEKRQRRGD